MSSNPIPDSIEADAQSYLQGRADAEMGIGAYSDVTDIACGPYTSMFIRNDGSTEYVKLFGLLADGPTSNILVYKGFSLNNP